MGFIFIMPGYDCEKQHRVGIKLMCPFVEKLLKFRKVCGSGPKKCPKEVSRVALSGVRKNVFSERGEILLKDRKCFMALGRNISPFMVYKYASAYSVELEL